MLENGYDLLVVLWGLVFVVTAVGFIFGMNGVFQYEEHKQDNLSDHPST